MTTPIYELLDRSASRALVAQLDLAALKACARRRTRLRQLALAGTAAVLVVAVSLGTALLARTGDQPERVTTAPTPTASPAFDAYSNGLWPFTSAGEAKAWRNNPSAMPWANDKAQVVQHYLTDVLGLQGLRVESLGCPKCFEQHIAGDKGGLSADAALVGDPDGPFSIVNVIGGVGSTQPPAIDTPIQFGSISSPTAVAGRGSDMDGLPTLVLFSSDGKPLTHLTSTTGSGARWTASLNWTDQTWKTAGIAATTRDHLGNVTSLLVLPVHRATT